MKDKQPPRRLIALTCASAVTLACATSPAPSGSARRESEPNPQPRSSEADTPASPQATGDSSASPESPAASTESLGSTTEPPRSAAAPLNLPLPTPGTPWKLDVSEFPQVKLQNISDRTQLYLPDSLIQQSRLRLFDQDGIELVPVDYRARMKFDNRVWKSSYLPLEPGEATDFNSPRVFDDPEPPEIKHATFRWAVHPHSTYRGYIEWHSERNDYGTESGQRGKHDQIWQGTVYSEAVVLKTR